MFLKYLGQKYQKSSEVYNMGDEVDAKVLSIDIEDKKISLGVKQLTPDPWDEIEENIWLVQYIKL